MPTNLLVWAYILAEVAADVLTIYDENGVDNVYEATLNRDHLRELISAQQELALLSGEEFDGPGVDVESAGTPSAGIADRVHVSSTIAAKRAAMVAHRSQIAPHSFFFAMPEEYFTLAFGSE
ncbi:MAG: hypothetical protein ACC652_06890 [Acidimicrobiales bacterium]